MVRCSLWATRWERFRSSESPPPPPSLSLALFLTLCLALCRSLCQGLPTLYADGGRTELLGGVFNGGMDTGYPTVRPSTLSDSL